MMRKSKTIPGMITLLVTVVMLLTLIGSAFASNAQTYNNDESSVYGSIFPTRYSASVFIPTFLFIIRSLFLINNIFFYFSNFIISIKTFRDIYDLLRFFHYEIRITLIS